MKTFPPSRQRLLNLKPAETDACEFLSQRDVYINTVKGGQSSSWRSFEELLTSSRVVLLLVCDSSVRGGSGGRALAAVWRLRGRGEVGREA